MVNRKGGVGKTTSALNIASGLHRRGYRVLMIDLDSQCCLSHNIGLRSDEVQHNIYDVLTGTVTADKTLCETTEGEILTGSTMLANADITITGDGREYRLRDALEPIRNKFDFVVIDTAPALNILIINALSASDSAIIAVEAKQSSIDGMEQLYGTIKDVWTNSNKDLRIRGILITRFKARTTLGKDMRKNLERIADLLQTKVYTSEIGELNVFGEAEAMHQSVFQYAPNSKGADQYNSVINEILRGGE